MADQTTVNEYALEVANLKGISSTSPYTKFQASYHRFSVCMLTRLEKLEVCKILFTIERYSYVYNDRYFPLIICKKIEITIDKSDLPNNSRSTEIYGYKCPIPARIEKLANERLSRTLTNMAYYISSGNLSSWGLMYYSHASGTPKIKPDIAIVEFPVEILSNLKEKEREQRYFQNPFYRKNLFTDSSPARINEPTDSERMLWSYPEAEKYVQAFVTTIKDNKFPYNRFQITCHQASVCSLTGAQRAASCKHSFEKSKYKLLSGAGTSINEGCERKKIFFEYLEMPPRTMAVLNCPLLSDVSKNLYYLSAAGKKDDFIAYMQVYPHEELLADAVIHEIAEIVKPSRTEPQNTEEQAVDDQLSALTLD